MCKICLYLKMTNFTTRFCRCRPTFPPYALYFSYFSPLLKIPPICDLSNITYSEHPCPPSFSPSYPPHSYILTLFQIFLWSRIGPAVSTRTYIFEFFNFFLALKSPRNRDWAKIVKNIRAGRYGGVDLKRRTGWIFQKYTCGDIRRGNFETVKELKFQ